MKLFRRKKSIIGDSPIKGWMKPLDDCFRNTPVEEMFDGMSRVKGNYPRRRKIGGIRVNNLGDPSKTKKKR